MWFFFFFNISQFSCDFLDLRRDSSLDSLDFKQNIPLFKKELSLCQKQCLVSWQVGWRFRH